MDSRLSDYIRQAKANDMTGNQIRSELIKAGWSPLEVEEALAKSDPIHPDKPKNKLSAFFKTIIIILFVLTMLGAAVFGFWYLDQKIKNEGANVSFEDKKADVSQESSTSSGLTEEKPSGTASVKLASIPSGYLLKEAYSSPDGGKILWTAEKNGQKIIFLNDLKSEAYEAVSGCQFNANGSHFFCIGTKNKKKVVILDTKEGNQYELLLKEPVFSLNGESLAYLAKTGANKFLVVNGKEYPFPYDSAGKLVFSSDGYYLAYIAAKGTAKFLIVNGSETKIEGEVFSDPFFSSGNEKAGYAVKIGSEIYKKEVEIE